jgi:signal transduction histidine kinase
MLADTERLAGLIENIMEAGKYDQRDMRLRFQPVEIGPFLKEIIQEFKRQIEERECDLKLEIQDSPMLHIDKRSMRMVFTNLIGNALRYSPSRASLGITVKNIDGHCKVEVFDQGIGLDKKEIKKIFRKFYRVQNKETQNIEGAGLGLYIAKEIVQNHKGKIQVFSEGREKGTRFVVSLPLRFVYKEQG